MTKLKLAFNESWNGVFKPEELNLLLVFQVNCPGCFMHAFPMVKEVLSKYEANLNFVAMSTAFEDFDLNTAANTELLLEQNEFVGETKKADQVYQFKDDNLPGNYPILMDELENTNDFLTPELIESICQTNPHYELWTDKDQKLLQQKVIEYYGSMGMFAHTFNLNQFRGTPTFVLFNKDYDILDSWFGDKPFSEIESIIDKWI